MTPQNEDKPTFKILNGPSKWNLVLALFEEADDGSARTVKFHFETLPTDQEPLAELLLNKLPAYIMRVGRIGNVKDEKWEIDGFILATGMNFSGIYSTKTRKGEIFFSRV